ncbi:MAG: CRISPR-associated protein Cas4 [Candidatus Marinimicrobia bacterium]|nr:CRISPR-associated protein Cas4 [Candidatus Neomarinimicrobiota bacterium]
MTYTAVIFDEDDLLPLSALQHLVFCARQCALIHIEQMWTENVLTAEGRMMHEKAHREEHESRGSIRIEYGMPLRSLKLGLIGKSDIVEFHRQGEKDQSSLPFPVEYKRGKPKANDCDRVQLCAQALCLEEMLDVHIPAGALYYGKTRRRQDVLFDSTLRTTTEKNITSLHKLIRSGRTPPAVWSAKCTQCSLIEQCLPKQTDGQNSALDYLRRMLRE